MASDPNANPFCVRLTPDLREALTLVAQQAGVTPSEWVRNLIYQTVYGEPLGMTEGYIHGKNAAFTASMRAISAAIQTALESVVPPQ